MSTAGAVLTAAGSGSRLGAAMPKALVELAGVPLVAHAAARLARSGRVGQLVVTAPADCIARVRAAVQAVCAIDLEVVPGGVTRQASVASGLAVLDAQHEIVLVHDAARPLASVPLIDRLIDTVANGYDAVVPAVPVTDTIKEVDDAEPPRAVRTLARAQLRAVQTPQAFRASLLRAAHAEAAPLATDERTAVGDDAGLVERLGHEVRVVEGEPRALKITTGHDLAIAALFLEEDS